MNLANPTPHRSSPVDAAGLWRRWGGLLIGAVVLALLAALVWHLLSDTASQKRQVADAPMLMLPPPPPPPPPEPEKLPEPEPEKIKPEVVEREPTPVESAEPPKDDAPPSPSQDLGDPVTIDGPAQAGTDAFGIGAGRGGGMTGGTGGGLGSGSYGRYVANALQQALARDPRTRQLTFDDIQIDLWLDAAGKTTRVQLVKSTGNAQSDEAVLAMAREMNRIDESPPASVRFPMRVSMRGRRP